MVREEKLKNFVTSKKMKPNNKGNWWRRSKLEPKLLGPKEAEGKYECDHELLTSSNKLNGLLPTLSVHLKLVFLMSIFFRSKFI